MITANTIFFKEIFMSTELVFRFAERKDSSLIFDFIKGIAKYEKMEDEVENTPALIEKWLFDEHRAEVIFALLDGKEIGFALFFCNYSTFVGRPGIHLEDIFVLPEYRGKGYGKALFKKVAETAKERNCGRLEWVCLDWNKPSIDFYLSMGAQPMSEWTTYRLAGESLEKAAE